MFLSKKKLVILHYLDIKITDKETKIMEKTLDLEKGTTLYTVDFERERFIPIVVTDLTNKMITLKNNSNYKTFFNCEGVFSYASFLKMFGTSLFVSVKDAVAFNEKLSSIKEYGVKSACICDDKNEEKGDIETDKKKQLIKQAILQSDMPWLALNEGFIDYILSNKEYTETILHFV